jgi:hypothetical protein
MFWFRCSWVGSGTMVDLLALTQCGPMPFARVAQHRVLQSDSSSSGNRRSDVSQVHGLTLDTNFAAIPPPSQYVLFHQKLWLTHTAFFLRNRDGSVQFTLQGMNAKGGQNTVTPVRRGGHWHARSGYGSRHGIHRRNFITDGLNGPCPLLSHSWTRHANALICF